jgi:hypothetical protein
VAWWFPASVTSSGDEPSVAARVHARVRERSQSGLDRARRAGAAEGDEKPTDRRPVGNDFGHRLA